MQNYKRINRFIAVGVLVITLGIYLKTVAPTTSFWDCGEFIASSYTLSVPHPPGAPLYLMLGRVFILVLAFIQDIGLRVNLISVLTSAFTIFFLYLIIVRFIRYMRGEEKTPADMVLTYSAGVVGSLALAFSHSQWFNAAEAEVYSVSVFLTAFATWLVMVWVEKSKEKDHIKYILLVFYLMGLSLGVHLLTVVVIPALAAIVYFEKVEKVGWKSFSLYVATSMAILLAIYPGVVHGLPMLIEKSTYSMFWFLLSFLFFAMIIFGTNWAKKRGKILLESGLVISLLLLIGYSTYLYIYIRSGLQPPINENTPDNLQRMLSYLRREQYGAESQMGNAIKWVFSGFSDAFRNAPFWSYQIKKMFLRYIKWQFWGYQDKLYVVPLIFCLFGAGYHFFKDWKRAFVVLVFFVMAGLALIVYQNQADPQPRERDYFYGGAFFAMAIWIGIGAAAFMEWASQVFKKGRAHTVTRGAAVLLFLLIPVNLFIQNLHAHDRSGNFVAWDYSYNILQTCEPDAVIFTNGDNDTFPLWYLQEVEHIRKDVRVINLSLLNTDWYIKQLKHQEPRVPMTFTDDYIEKYLGRHDLEALRTRYWPNKDSTITITTPDSSIAVKVKPTLRLPIGDGVKGKNFLRVQDWMILNIIFANSWQRPVYFAVTVPRDNLIGLQPYFRMDGLAWKLLPYHAPPVDEETLRKNLFETYIDHYRGLNDGGVYFNPNIKKLVQNYRSAFLQLAYYHYTHHQRDQMAEILDEMERLIPERIIPIQNKDLIVQIGKLYFDAGRPDEFKKRLDRLVADPRLSPQDAFQLGALYLQFLKNDLKAEELFHRSYRANPRDGQTVGGLLRVYEYRKDYPQAVQLLQEWLVQNPGDSGAVRRLRDYQKKL
ncbi:DUF2723 domain-containing protein [candidate division KSB1 bacterium]|nr:DUF2723 domain-containing protein [candidate division KSB1 bacterium]